LWVEIGLLLNWSPFVQWNDGHLVVKGFQQVRIMGVLQRIGVSYLLAALILYYAKPRGAFVIGCIILLV
jgi:predicted acyltransferase